MLQEKKAYLMYLLFEVNYKKTNLDHYLINMTDLSPPRMSYCTVHPIFTYIHERREGAADSFPRNSD